MKVITLTEPWATLVVIGAKEYETRDWKREPQGRILVHAAKAMSDTDRLLVEHEPFASALGKYFSTGLPKDILAKLDERRGKVIGSVHHLGCKRTESVRDGLTPFERAFGNYYDGRWAWKLAAPLEYKTFVPARGMLGIWTLPPELEPDIYAAAAEVKP